MQYRQLGNSDLRVSTVALGCWAITGDFTWGPQDVDDARDAVDAAIDHGINLFDTAELYGDGSSETMLGDWLGPRRDKLILATKISDQSLGKGERIADAVEAACDRSLQRLRTDRIDLYQIHWPYRAFDWDETFTAMDKLRQAGKVRYVGVSNFGVRDMDDLHAVLHRNGLPPVPSNQLNYSLLARAIEYDIQTQCAHRNTGILCYSPLAQGLLTGKFHSPDEVPDARARTRHFSSERPHTRHGGPGCEPAVFDAIGKLRVIGDRLGEPMADIALAWCLHQRAVVSVIAGARNRKQVEQNVRGAGLPLGQRVLHELNEATEPVKQALGPSADLWESPENSRMR
jgi:aryl-alcohol dehydrogenase-like predicted oxidoreductase